MATAAIDLLAALRQHRLLQPTQLEELKRLTGKSLEPRALASKLVERGWLTPFQSDLLLHGRGEELVMEPYIVLDRLGEGKVGQIYKARHRTLERTVTLKIFRKELTEYDVLARFYREVRLVSQVNHPNIVHAYDAGPIGGQHMIVMEHVVGTDLGRYVGQRGPLPVGQACDYIRQAAAGLQHAHERGLVHRDIQPSNLLLTPPLQTGVPGTGSGNVVKILDLGLGRLRRSERDGGNTQLTLLGSSEMEFTDYTAPEQALDFHKADIRADIFGLGGSLFMLLTGKPPTVQGTPGERLLHLQSAEPLVLEAFRRDLPPGLPAVYRRMMACRAVDRYQTPAQVAQALAPFCSNPPLPVAVPASTRDPLLVGRRLRIVALVCLGLLLGVIGLIALRPGSPAARPVGAALTSRATTPVAASNTSRATTPAEVSPAVGTWKWTSAFGGREYTLRLKLDGDRLTGVLTRDGNDSPVQDAKFEAGKLSFSTSVQRNGQRYTAKYSGELKGDTIKGQYTADFGGQARTREWEAKRATE